jgi:putative NADH-flavin reductase
MKIVVFGASGPTGLELCRQALAAGHQVVAAVRRPSDFQLRNDALTIVQADVTDGSPLNPAINGSDAVLSVLGAAYSRHVINVYSVGTKAIVAAMRASDHCRRLVVVSSGMTMHPLPKVRGFFMDEVMVPFLRNVIGRTLYADMARMEDYLATCDDIEWTIMRPGRLVNGDGVTKYQLADDFPVGNVTSRPDLAAAMLAELGPNPHVHQKMSPTTR